jgi:glycosyltransferase involved in cell wall biosynthesis
MRIFFISGEYPPGISGMGDYSKQLAVHLTRLSHKVVVLTSKNGASQNIEGIEVLRQIESWNFKSWEAVKTAIKVWNPEVIHLQYMTHTFGKQLFPCFLPMLIKSAFPGLKIVTTFHEFAAPFNRLGLLPLLFWSDAYIITNQHHLHMLTKIKNAFRLRKPIYKIPLAANILPSGGAKNSRPIIREQLGLATDEVLLVRFGILHAVALPQIIKWLDAFTLMRKENLPVKLLLIGKAEPESKAELLEEIQKRNLHNFVLLKTDLAPDIISAYLYASDIGLALYPDGISEKRTACLALFAHELPVAAIQKQPLPPEFKDGENLLCVSIDSKDEGWVKTIRSLITNNALRDKLVRETKEVTRLHDWTHIAEQTAKVYSL